MLTDTHPTAAAVQLAVLRRLGPAARVTLAFELSELTRQLRDQRMRAALPATPPRASLPPALAPRT